MGNILIKGARVNNLKNVTVEIERNKLVVITGVSGSGKSSLAFDTLYAEGQRRYVESLSSYARQFLARMEKPDVDYIQGIAPAMAIEQRTSTGNPRATVGTTTEIYDFLKLLFARAGRTYSPISGQEVRSDSVTDVVDFCSALPDGSRVQILAQVPVRSKGYRAELELALQKGFSRLYRDGKPHPIEEELESLPAKGGPQLESLLLLIDRLSTKTEETDEQRLRLADSIRTAYAEGHGTCQVVVNDEVPRSFSDKFELDGMAFERPSVNLFAFNNPYGACKACEGFGRVMGIDEGLVIPNPNLSVYENCVAPWNGEVMSEYKKDFIAAAASVDFPIHRPYADLDEKQKQQLWDGIGKTWGINQFFTYVQTQMHKVQYRVMLARYRGYTTCPECKGSRIRKDASYVRIGGVALPDLLMMQLNALPPVIEQMHAGMSEHDRKVAKRLFHEIRYRVDYLIRVGVGYLMLNRRLATLSGGEMQRIRLATSLGSGLVGSMYILDEPSIGLHPRDTDALNEVLLSLRNAGNTVIVVEHDESIMRLADQLIDMGPGAGELGGEVVFNGVFADMMKTETLTSDYLSGRKEIPVPAVRRPCGSHIRVEGARMHNLRGVGVTIPLHALTVVTGVSGSGKTTLIQEVVYPTLQRLIADQGLAAAGGGAFVQGITGDIKLIRGIEMVDQQPIGRSARSNPVTYTKAYDLIRELYASQHLAKTGNLKAGAFSFNVDGGRCDECKGDGTVTIEMQFLPDVTLVCESCGGKRFKKNVLDVTYKGKNISEVLGMTITEAITFFESEPKIVDRLEVLARVGLGYLRLGQSTSTLSGGEVQRLKLASFLGGSEQSKGTLYIFDEPTTGLHFDDIRKLMRAVDELIERGNTVLIIEHNVDVIKCADWIIDMGPEGGDKGGTVVYQGTPEGLLGVEGSYTAKYLKGKV